MSRRRKLDSEESEDRLSTSLRLPVSLLERMDNAWRSSDEFTGRTHFIEKACEHYLNCEKCPVCGNLNHKQSVICSMCETKLEKFSKIVDEVASHIPKVSNLIQNTSDVIEQYDNLNEKINWLLEKLTPANKSAVERILSIIVSPHSPTNTRVLEGRYLIMVHKLYSTYDDLSLVDLDNPSGQYQEVLNTVMSDLSSKQHLKGPLFFSRNDTKQCESICYYLRSCEIMIKNPNIYTTQMICESYERLQSVESRLLSISGNMIVALETLRSIEEMITILMQNQNP